MIEISDINDTRISYFKNLRFTPVFHTKEKLFITEGEKVTLKLLESDYDLISLFAVKEFYSENQFLISKKKIPQENLFYADKSLMNQIVGYKHHSCVMALAKQPRQFKLNELNSPIVVMNGIINSENVGSIVRNCAAFGVNSIIVDGKTSSPFLRRAVRVSMGAVLDIKVCFSENIIEDLEILKQENYSIISVELNSNSKPFIDIKFPDKFVLIFGNEDKGVDVDILKFSDSIIHIPITNKVNSINVASSSAVILSKIFEQNS